jgi:hypothetical protein
MGELTFQNYLIDTLCEISVLGHDASVAGGPAASESQPLQGYLA